VSASSDASDVIDVIDEPVAQRQSEAIDPGALGAFLREKGVSAGGDVVVQQFPGGASNLTYLARVGADAFVVRRAPPGARAKTAHDVVREARLMEALRPRYPLVPRVLATCEDDAVLGTQFYVMERLRGVILRRDAPLAIDPAQATRLCERFVDAFTALHHVDVTGPLGAFGKGQGYVVRQIEGWTERYAKARTDDVPGFDDVTAWLKEQLPGRRETMALVHNDFRFDNLVLDPDDDLRPIGVLDWEMATLGDPRMDVGASLAYWVQADDDGLSRATRRQPTHLPGMFTRRALWSRMAFGDEGDGGDMRFYEVYGVFRLAGILQQIYARFVAGATTNPAFAGFGELVRHLEKRAVHLMKNGGER